MEKILDTLRSNLTVARDSQEHFANTNRTPAPAYKVSDLIFLDTQNLTSARPTEKLDSKFISAYKIIEKINSHAYRLDLPFEHELKNNSFYVSLLRPAPSDPLPSQTQAPALPVVMDKNSQKVWGIKTINDSRQKKGKFWYHIVWRDGEEQTWEPLENVINAYTLRCLFHKAFPRKLKPSKKDLADVRSLLKSQNGE